MSADLLEMRRKAMRVGVSNMETEELVFLAKNNTPPLHVVDLVNWFEREAYPLLLELGDRLEATLKPAGT